MKNTITTFMNRLTRSPGPAGEERHSQSETAPPLSVTAHPGTVYITTETGQLSTGGFSIRVTNTGSTYPLPVTAVSIRLPATLFRPGSQPAVKMNADETLWQVHSSPGEDLTVTAISAQPNWLMAGEAFTFGIGQIILTTIAGEAGIRVNITFAGGAEVSRIVSLKMEPAAAGILSFKSIPSVITAGQSATLSWTCSRIDYCCIEPLGPLQLPASGSINVNPAITTRYTLNAFTADTHLELEWTLFVEKGPERQPS